MSTVDLSEPWRWACPECGSVTIRPNAGHEREPTLRRNRYFGARGAKENYRDARAYNCVRCGSAFDQPIDRKEAE